MKLQDVVDYVFGRREYYHEFMEYVMMDIEAEERHSKEGLYGWGFDNIRSLAYSYFGSSKAQAIKLYELLLDTVDDYNRESFNWMPEIPTVTRGRRN